MSSEHLQDINKVVDNSLTQKEHQTIIQKKPYNQNTLFLSLTTSSEVSNIINEGKNHKTPEVDILKVLKLISLDIAEHLEHFQQCCGNRTRHNCPKNFYSHHYLLERK